MKTWYEQEKELYGLDNKGLSHKLIEECVTSLLYLRSLDYAEQVDIAPATEAELDELEQLFGGIRRELGGE